MAKEMDSCVEPAAGPLATEDIPAESAPRSEKGVSGMTTARIGKKAPDFEAPAYQGGAFGQVKLSDYQGKWGVLCFYPGDFTFV